MHRATRSATHPVPYLDAYLGAHLRGDADATQRLIRDLRSPIKRRIRYTLYRHRAPDYLATPEIIEELVQETLLALFRDKSACLRSFDPEGPLHLVPYVLRIATRQASNYLQQCWTQKRGAAKAYLDCLSPETDGRTLAPPHPSPEARLEARDLAQLLLAHLMTRLSLRGQAAFRILFIDRLSTEEAATRLGGGVSCVHNWRRRIRLTAEDILAEQGLSCGSHESAHPLRLAA